MPPHELAVLRREHLDALGLDWASIIDVLDAAFRAKAEGLVQNPPKPRVAPREGAFVNAMPAYLGGADRLGLKWVSGYETNPAAGHPYIYGTLVMNDPATGLPIGLLDGGWVTEMRTPAVSGLVMRHLGDGIRTLAIIGCGVQGRRHLEVALDQVSGLERIQAFDVRPEAVAALQGLAGGIPVCRAESAQAALAGADLVVTCLTSRLPERIGPDGTAPDCVFLPVDYDDAITPAVVNEAVLFLVDDRDQYGSALARAFGGFRAPDGELADLVTGMRPLPPTGRRVVLNMGLAMADVALGGLSLDRAVQRGVGDRVRFP